MGSTDKHEQVGQKQDFPAMLRHYRQVTGWTQEQLAERAGVSVRSISNLERGSRHVPRGDTIRMIASALELPAEAIKPFMAAARTREADPAAVPDLSPSEMVSALAIPITATRDSTQEVALTYEFLRRVGGLLREIG